MALLPSAKKSKETQDPKNLIIFSLPKCGKTSALSQLDGNLIVDLECGTKYVEGYVVQTNNYVDLFNLANELITQPHNFKHVSIDTVTALEDIAAEYAADKYKASAIGKNWESDGIKKNGRDLLQLPNGQGYGLLRDAMQEIIGWFERTGLDIILVCHVKDKLITDKAGELSVRAIDLTGKIGNILSAKSDAIGFMYRDTEKNQVYIDFGASGNTVISCARPPHLNGKKLLLSEMDENGNLICHWDDIYTSLKK